MAKKLCNQGYTVLEEPRIQTGGGTGIPDLIAHKENMALVLDAQVICDSFDTDRAHKTKVDKYRRHKDQLKELTGAQNIRIGSITLSWKGIWSSKSLEDLLLCRVLEIAVIKILSTRVLVGGILSFWTFNATTATAVRARRGVG